MFRSNPSCSIQSFIPSSELGAFVQNIGRLRFISLFFKQYDELLWRRGGFNPWASTPLGQLTELSIFFKQKNVGGGGVTGIRQKFSLTT